MGTALGATTPNAAPLGVQGARAFGHVRRSPSLPPRGLPGQGASNPAATVAVPPTRHCTH